jgi:hypothetical protein
LPPNIAPSRVVSRLYRGLVSDCRSNTAASPLRSRAEEACCSLSAASNHCAAIRTLNSASAEQDPFRMVITSCRTTIKFDEFDGGDLAGLPCLTKVPSTSSLIDFDRGIISTARDSCHVSGGVHDGAKNPRARHETLAISRSQVGVRRRWFVGKQSQPEQIDGLAPSDRRSGYSREAPPRV